MLVSIFNGYTRNRPFRYKVVSLQVVSIQTQAVKLHENFVHFKYSLRVNKKNL